MFQVFCSWQPSLFSRPSLFFSELRKQANQDDISNCGIDFKKKKDDISNYQPQRTLLCCRLLLPESGRIPPWTQPVMTFGAPSRALFSMAAERDDATEEHTHYDIY
jgi:hypothetical protein